MKGLRHNVAYARGFRRSRKEAEDLVQAPEEGKQEGLEAQGIIWRRVTLRGRHQPLLCLDVSPPQSHPAPSA